MKNKAQDCELVAIWMVTYNHEHYISKAIESVLAQKTNFRYRLYIGEDCSTDDTRRICIEYEKQFPDKIKLVLNHTNDIIRNLRNTYHACFNSGCKYIALLEGDDYWTDPYKLQKQVDFLESNESYVVCYHDALIIDEKGNILSKSKLPENLKTDFSAEELIKGAWLLTLSMCFRNVLPDLPEEYYKVKNGDKFLTSLIGNYGKGKYLDQIENAVYRKHSTSIWSSLDKVNQIFYNGDTRAWLFRYYDRIGKVQYAEYFKKEVVSHFRSLFHEMSTTPSETYENVLNKVISNYTDIVDSNELRGLLLPLKDKECLPESFANHYQGGKYILKSAMRGDGFTQKILRVTDRELIESNGLTVDWILTRKCNYRCSYCTVHNNRTGYFVPVEKLKTIIDKLSLLPNETITLALSGGEPTLHPNYFDFVEYAIEKLKDRLRIQTQTNLSKSLSFYKKFIDRFNGRLNQLSFLASYHFEFAKKDSFLENIKYLSENNVDVLFKICAEPNHMDEVRRIYSESKSIVNEHLDVVLVVVRHNYGSLPDKRYSQADLDWLSCNRSEDRSIRIDYSDSQDEHKIKSEMFSSNNLIISKKNKFKGMLCNAGLNLISISGDGSLDPAVCFRKTTSKKKNVYANPDSILKFQYPIICPFETCYVPNDQRVPKYSIDLVRTDIVFKGADKTSIQTEELKRLKFFLENHALAKTDFLISKNEFIKAKQILNLLSEYDPNNTHVINKLSAISIMDKDYEEALKLIKKVLDIDPQNTIAFDNFYDLKRRMSKMSLHVNGGGVNKNREISLTRKDQIVRATSRGSIANKIIDETGVGPNIESPANPVCTNISHDDSKNDTLKNRTDISKDTDKVIRFGSSDLFNSDIIKINWTLTRKCNYSCSYCGSYNNNVPFSSKSKVQKAVDGIISLNKKKIVLTITGGEPTRDPNFLYVMDSLLRPVGKLVEIVIITNLSRRTDFYEKFIERYHDHTGNITFVTSYHFEFANTDRFVNNAKILAEGGCEVLLWLVAHPLNMDKVREVYETANALSIQNLKVSLKIVRDNQGASPDPDKKYKPEDIEWLSHCYEEEAGDDAVPVFIDFYDSAENKICRKTYAGNELIALNLNKSKGMVCNAGVNMITIDHDGYLGAAVCMKGKKENIYHDANAFEKVKGPVICPFDACACLADIQLPKYLEGFENNKPDNFEADVKQVNSIKLSDAIDSKGWAHKADIYTPHFEYVSNLKNTVTPSISVIVISWRLHPDNLKSFQVLEQQKNQNFELIFVDNGAAPGEFDPLKPYIDTYIRLNTNTGAYLARNVGALFAQAPVLFFLEDDGLPADNLIKAHLEAFAKYDVIAVRGVYRFKNNANPFNKLAHHYYLGDLPYPRYSDLEGNSSYLAENFFKVGGWDDEIIFGGGGIELAIRLMRSEPDMRKQIYSPEPVILHDYVADDAHLQAKRKKQNQSFERLREKHPIFDSFQHGWNRFIGHHEMIPRRMDAPLEAVALLETPIGSLLGGIYSSYQSGDIGQAEKKLGEYQHRLRQGI